ncbi:hypothetical protein H4R33_003809 [Dimargaris cristalligena]|nr:hypothetical protein H4R33_003809 [Dimargaris cristalligena]
MDSLAPIGFTPHNRGQKLRPGAERVHRGRRLWTHTTGDLSTAIAAQASARAVVIDSQGMLSVPPTTTITTTTRLDLAANTPASRPRASGGPSGEGTPAVTEAGAATAMGVDGEFEDDPDEDIAAINERVMRPLTLRENILQRPSVRWTLEKNNYLTVLAANFLDALVKENQLNVRIRQFLAYLLSDDPKYTRPAGFPAMEPVEDQHQHRHNSNSNIHVNGSANGGSQPSTATAASSSSSNGPAKGSGSTAQPITNEYVTAPKPPAEDPTTTLPIDPAQREELVFKVQQSLTASDEYIYRLRTIRARIIQVLKQRTQVCRRLRWMAKRDGHFRNSRSGDESNSESA